MKPLISMLIILTFAGCAHPGVFRKKPVGNWAEFDQGNRLKGSQWSGNGCAVSQDSMHLAAVMGEEGVCFSEPVSVVPGHYDFSVLMKIQAVSVDHEHPLDDALSLRLHIYDRKGRELDPHQPFLGKMIDTGEVNYGLNRIGTTQGLEEFSRLHLAPRYHPFDSLWLPEKAAQVRVEVRLKGPAVLHLKDFQLTYDKWNFPLRERVAKLGKGVGVLVPKPQEMKDLGESWILDPAKDQLCIEGDLSALATERGIWEFEQKLSRLGFETPLPRHTCTKANWLLRLIQSKDLGHGSEAYRMQVGSSGQTKQLKISAASPRATYYALQTLSQLFEKTPQGQVKIRPLEIFDYPAFPLRSTTGYDRRARLYRQEVEAGRWIASTRMNAILLNIAGNEPRWWITEPILRDAVKRLGTESRESGLFDLGIHFNPYQDRVDPKSKKILRFSDDQTYREMENALKPFLQSGVKHFFLATDDLPPRQEGARFSYRLEDELDQETLQTLSHAHARMIASLDSFVRKNFPHTQLYFVPPWYNNLFVDLSEAKQGEPYLHDLSHLISKQIPILWTGPTVRSLSIDQVQIEKYSGYLNGRKPMLWDNTLYARRLDDFWGTSKERAHLCSLLEPYDVALPENFSELNHPAGVFLNGELNEFYRIQLATAGAYFWNPKSYQPEAMLWGYLKHRFGEKGAQLILDLDAKIWEFAQSLRSGKPKASLHDDALEILAKLEGEIQSQGGGDLLDEFRDAVFHQEVWLRQIKK